MARAFKRRTDRAHGFTYDRLVDSKWIVWCYDPEHMPAMIDLLIAKGVLKESDRPHCLHWQAVRGDGVLTQEDFGRMVDADAMLAQTGRWTISGELSRNSEVAKTVRRELSGEASPDDLICAERTDS